MKPFIATIAWLAFLLLPLAAAAQTSDEIIWPYFAYPPYVILNGEQPTGIYWEIREMIWKELVQYDHRPLESPFNRSYRAVEDGSHYCFTGLLKSEEREMRLTYSLPVAIGGPHGVVCRRGSLDRFKRNGKVSLRELLDQPDLLMSHVDGFSHGSVLDSIIEPWIGTGNVQIIKRMSPMDDEFHLVERGRIDYFVSHSFNSQYMYEQSGISGLEFIPVMEDPEPFVSYVACTRGPWGEEVIAAVNGVIARHADTEEYLSIFRPWLQEDLWPEFAEEFERLVAAPARAYRLSN